MYAIFEEVVGPQPTVTYPKNKDLQNLDNEDQGIVVTSNDPQSPADSENCDSAFHYASSKTRSKRNSTKHQRTYGSSSYLHRHSSTLPRSSRRHLLPSSSTAMSNDLDELSSLSSSNPLLDTISVLTYDPPDDSDDYYDLASAYEQCHNKEREKQSKTSSVVSQGTEGDRDSIGYAGSSSIDSGYKSFCPTPEIPDSSIYGTDVGNRTHSYSGLYGDSSSSSQVRNTKHRIMMGTKVIARQSQVSPSPLRESPASRRSDSSLYDVNLDHLMYLRQSLLSAIQKYESSRNETTSEYKQNKPETHHGEKCLNPVEDQNYTDSSPAKTSLPSYQKTVRFNTNVKVSTVNSSQPPSESAEQNSNRDTAEQTCTSKVQSKSILKDPLCANLRSQLEAGSSGDCTLEEEIDSLLYGRAEFYDLESVDDFPCSYVTMIEEKYRSGKPSLAKVRKLKSGKVQDTSPKPASATEIEPTPSTAVVSEEDTRQQKPFKDSAGSSTVTISKTAKCRFTEVARCMLEIIEDLQIKKLHPDSDKESSNSNADSSGSTPLAKAEDVSTDKNIGADSKCEYASAAEYHVYEEIVYDFAGSGTLPPPKKVEMPPPLPARPSTIFQKTEQHCNQKSRAPSPPPRKGRCPLKRSAQMTEGSGTEVRNRPKQRGNLYCLFADRTERRNISRSLEREWRVAGTSDDQEDDYGFRKEFPSI